MNKRYRVIFSGLLQTEEFFKEKMSLLGVSHETAEKIIRKAPVILKDNMSVEDVRLYADAVQNAGGKVNIQAHGIFEDTSKEAGSLNITPLENFIMCPQCGHKQLKIEACEKCGLNFKKMEERNNAGYC